MLYGGKEYGAEPKLCPTCDMPVRGTSYHSDCCYKCGSPGCSRCLVTQDHGTEKQTGYQDVILLCPECDAKGEG